MASAVAFVGCMKRPVLYPNAHLGRVGAQVAERDIEECMRYAKAQGHEGRQGASRAAGEAATSAGVGAAGGAAAGAVFDDAGRGAAAGAAGAGAASVASSILRPRDPDPVFRSFVDTCLREKGYQPIGWR
jgi:hypothetical protein